MLSYIEHVSSTGEKLSSSALSHQHYEQNVGQIDWSRARIHLPLTFQTKYMPEEEYLQVDDYGNPERKFPIVNGIAIPVAYSGLLTKEEFEKIMAQEGRSHIFSNMNIPTKDFEPYLPTFTDLEWEHYTEERTLTEEQFDRYGWFAYGYYHYTAPLSRIPYAEENFEVIFSHPQLTMEFIQAHIQDALANVRCLLQTEVGYQIALQHLLQPNDVIQNYEIFIKIEDFDKYPQLITAELFHRSDLPMWFTDKHRESIGSEFNSLPSKKLLTWLEENRPETYQALEDPHSPHFRWTYRGDDDYRVSEINHEKVFKASVKKTLNSLF